MTVVSDHVNETPYLSVLRGAAAEQSTSRATIACVIPAYNEEDTIAEVLTALLNQSRFPDVIHVVINNSDDETFFVARDFAGPHERSYRDLTQLTEVFIHDIGVNKDKKVGALNYGFAQVCDNFDYFLGVDGDTVVNQYAVEHLEKEILSDPRIGGDLRDLHRGRDWRKRESPPSSLPPDSGRSSRLSTWTTCSEAETWQSWAASARCCPWRR